MRSLDEHGDVDVLSPEALSALQLHTIGRPLLPNVITLDLWSVHGPFVPFIPLFLSPRVTSISIDFGPDISAAMFASVVTAVPTLCPNLQVINLCCLPRDPMITAAVSGMALVTNRNTLQEFHVDSPLTDEGSKVVYKLPNLFNLSVVIERETSLPSVSLPNLTGITITCGNEDDWPRLFHGATFGKLKSVQFLLQSEEIGDFLGAFERAAFSSSIQTTLLELHIFTIHSWNPNCSSLLSFTQLVDLDIEFSCNGECSSSVDDDIVISLSQAMPKLTVLRLGYNPCREPTTGVTTKGLVALALHCPKLSILRVHFQVASLSAPHATEPTGLRTDCALKELVVGEMPVSEESALVVALTLLWIFPRIERIDFTDKGWEKVEDAIHLSKRTVDFSGK